MPKFKKIFFPLLIVLITVLICFLNYTPNTFLTGWDTLHPEFNFSLNFSRLLNLWHSEQGLGAIPAHAQISDLPRVFILYLFNFILPLSFLRYSYIFLMFILGPLGIYFLIKFLFINHKSNFINFISFLAALFYIFNLSTVQQFYVPFEMFPTQWAFLPWIILFSLKFLKDHSKKNLILFSIFTLFTTPQAYAPQLWYALFFIYTTFLLLYSSFNKKSFKKSLSLIVLTLLINAFWLIPNLFYIFNHSSAPLENRDNRLYSQEYLLRNRQNGTIADVSLIKGFYLNWSAFNPKNNSFTDLMPQWQNHFKNPLVLTIGYLLFISSFIGLIISFIKKDKNFIVFSPFFIVPFILLANQIPPFSILFDFLIKNSTIREAFRFIFTKLSILLLFGYTIYFSYFINFLFSFFKKISIIIFSIIISISLIFYCSPMFSGYLISPIVRVNIPQEYFQFWQFMSQQDDGRVLSLPLNQSSGWQYYNWGYQGSGFLWFNLKQNLLDRDSDRWSTQNEQSYKEFFYSLYNQNLENFANLFQKYNIKYIIWDKNIISPSDENTDQITLKYDTADLLNQLEKDQKIKLVRQFGSLLIYKATDESSKTTIKAINKFISPSYNWNYFDAAASDYVTVKNYSEYYPFRNILDNFQKINPEILSASQISNNQWQIKFLKNNGLNFSLPEINQTETDIPVSVFQNQNKLIFKFPFPTISLLDVKKEFILDKNATETSINNQTFDLQNNPLNDVLLGQVNISTQTQNYINNQPFNFNFSTIKTNTTSNLDFESTGNNLDISKQFFDLNKTSSYSINLDTLPQSFGYIIGFNSQYTSGIPLRFCFQNTYSLVCTVEDQLSKNQKIVWDYFIIPPNGFDFGYKLNISNISYGNTISESFLKNIVIIPIPFNLLSQTKSINPSPISPQKYLFLNQAYDSGWLAFYFKFGIPIFLKNHVLANNWANAWELPANLDIQNTSAPVIHILFWPQIFEYLGLIITSTTIIWVLKKK